MDLLAYWRFDNYLRDLDEGAGFSFSSNQSRLHTDIDLGERLWLFSQVKVGGNPEFRLLAKLVITAKTVNSPGYKYGTYRVWGDQETSEYYRVEDNRRHDMVELLRVLPMAGESLSGKDRVRVAQACQTIRAITRKASELLEAFSQNLADESRARALPDESKLEEALYAGTEQLTLLIQERGAGYSANRREDLNS